MVYSLMPNSRTARAAAWGLISPALFRPSVKRIKIFDLDLRSLRRLPPMAMALPMAVRSPAIPISMRFTRFQQQALIDGQRRLGKSLFSKYHQPDAIRLPFTDEIPPPLS